MQNSLNENKPRPAYLKLPFAKKKSIQFEKNPCLNAFICTLAAAPGLDASHRLGFPKESKLQELREAVKEVAYGPLIDMLVKCMVPQLLLDRFEYKPSQIIASAIVIAYGSFITLYQQKYPQDPDIISHQQFIIAMNLWSNFERANRKPFSYEVEENIRAFRSTVFCSWTRTLTSQLPEVVLKSLTSFLASESHQQLAVRSIFPRSVQAPTEKHLFGVLNM